MAQKVRGVVARSKGAPVTVETIVIPDPGPGEAVVTTGSFLLKTETLPGAIGSGCCEVKEPGE